MTTPTLRAVSEPYYTGLLQPSLDDQSYRVCPSAIFGTVHRSGYMAVQQASVILNADYNVPLPPHAQPLYRHGLGDIARVECFWEFDQAERYEYRGMVIYTSGKGATVPLVHVADAMLGSVAGGFDFGGFVLQQCGVPNDLVDEAAGDIWGRGQYNITFSREATIHVGAGYVVNGSQWPVSGDWRVVANETLGVKSA